MRLNLALNGVLIASAPLDSSRCKDQYYLEAMQQQLLQKNKDVLEKIPAEPLYYIEVPASSATLQFGRKS